MSESYSASYAAAGVDVCVAGTGVFRAPDVAAAIKELQNA